MVVIILFILSGVPNEIQVELKAYCPCEKCCGKWAAYGKTADGYPAMAFGLAAPVNFQRQSRQVVFVPGHGFVRPDDRASGTAWEIRRLDHEYAKDCGVEYVTLLIWR